MLLEKLLFTVKNLKKRYVKSLHLTKTMINYILWEVKVFVGDVIPLNKNNRFLQKFFFLIKILCRCEKIFNSVYSEIHKENYYDKQQKSY